MEDQNHLKRTRGHLTPAYSAVKLELNGTAIPNSDFDEPDAKRPRKAEENPSRSLIIHRVTCSASGRHQSHRGISVYQDSPRLRKGDSRMTALKGKHRIDDLERYLEDREISFFFYKDYDCDAYLASVEEQFVRFLPRELDPQVFKNNRDYFYLLPEDLPPPKQASERLEINSTTLRNTLISIVAQEPSLRKDWNNKRNMFRPYPFFFHHQQRVREIAQSRLSPSVLGLVLTLLSNIERDCSSEYEAANNLFSRGLVTKKHLGKIFRLSDVVVTFDDSEPKAFVIEDIAEQAERVTLQVWSYVFDGQLSKRSAVLRVDWPETESVQPGVELPDMEIPISSLSAYPLRYDGLDVEETLKDRGIKFWSCRKRRFVTYSAPRRSFDVQTYAPRFMVDFEMYRELHQKENDQNQSSRARENDVPVPAHIIDEDVPSDENFFLLLPGNVFGFSMKDKKWRDLQVEYIEPVSWNKNAFERLVLEHKKKELIEALISVHLANNKSNDIIEGKGNGLILLLHGGPGTGKTLTAESVAELAEKPLYRVTCGDLGTEAEQVEQYLESVLKIGTIWDCVVLLDEADVFLEERTHQDLQRNALVSVFLRVLEYYEGILILTTNRVGTFDEAFKSRVQLAVYYPALDEYGRRQIWRDALKSMQSEHVKFDLPSLLDRVDLLAGHKLNGRQIRSTVRSALQLAHFRGQTLSYQHFEQTVNVALEFESYVEKTHRHTADEWAIEQMTRADEAEL